MDLSTQLSYLFGTEEYVTLRRQLVLLRETFANHIFHEQNQHVICSGSLGEGVAYPKSDDDLMFALTNCRVVMTYREATQDKDVLMVPSEFSPGYCCLLDVKKSYNQKLIHIINGMPFLSSSSWKQTFAGEGQYIHGPCQSGTIGTLEFDHAYCISCSTWPDIANDWAIRERSYYWPSFEMIHNITQNGCHVVPVGDPDSLYCSHGWRMSFSVAERTLMHSFNHTQFLVYNLLRLTLKIVIEKILPGVLCSYFMKTALFYTSENTSTELWRVENLDKCFKACLSVLYDYIDHMYCPNYFIPEYNMFKRKVNHTNRHQMLVMLKLVHTIGTAGIIHLSGETSCLDASLSPEEMEYVLDGEFMSSYLLISCFMKLDRFCSNLPYINTECCLLALSRFLSLSECDPTMIQNHELISTFWYKGISSYCLRMMNHLFSLSEINKYYHRLYKTLEALLRIGYRGDVTTGKLTIATCMYLVGKTEFALYALRQLLSDYPPYAIDLDTNELQRQTYMDVMCGRGLTMNYKMRHAHAPRYRVDGERINAFPSPLKMWITIMAEILLDPLTYAYFLESLCHAHHQNEICLMKSLRCLINHMFDQKDDMCILNTRMCVGIIKYIQGDNQSACRWLGSVIVIKDTIIPPYNEEFSSSAVTYFACLLNKKFQSVI